MRREVDVAAGGDTRGLLGHDPPGRPARGGTLGRRPARPHELRRRVPEHAGASRPPGTGGRVARPREPRRQQGAAHPRHRRLASGDRPRVHKATSSSRTARSTTRASGATWACWACATTTSFPITRAMRARRRPASCPTNSDAARIARSQGGPWATYIRSTRASGSRKAGRVAGACPWTRPWGRSTTWRSWASATTSVTSEIWYRLLNCGFRIAAGAGTDAFPNFASLRGPTGLVRVYVRAGERLEHPAFLQGLSAGRTFVTNAPLLWFAVDGKKAGETIPPAAGTTALDGEGEDDLGRARGPRRGRRQRPRGRHRAACGTAARGRRARSRCPRRAAAGTCCARTANARGFPSSTSIRSPAPAPSTSKWAAVTCARARTPPTSRSWISRAEESVAAHTGWNTPAERAETLALLGARPR